MSVLLAWDVLSSDVIVISSQLIIALFIKVETLRIKEITSWENVEVVRVVLSRSIFDFLTSVFFHSWNRLRCFYALETTLRHHGCRVQVFQLRLWHRTISFEPVSLVWRAWFWLILELPVDEAILSYLLARIHFK